MLLFGITTFSDPSNRDPQFRRNRIRHELLPLLCDIADRDLVPVLVRQSELFRDGSKFISEGAKQIDPTDTKALENAPRIISEKLSEIDLGDTVMITHLI